MKTTAPPIGRARSIALVSLFMASFMELLDATIVNVALPDAQRALVKTNEEYYRLAERRYRTGVDSYLTLLDAQRQLFSVRQQLIGDRLAQLTSEVELYKALGGGWREQSQLASAPAQD